MRQCVMVAMQPNNFPYFRVVRMLVLGWLVSLLVAQGHCLMLSMQPNGSFPVIPSYVRLLLLLMFGCCCFCYCWLSMVLLVLYIDGEVSHLYTE